LTPAEREELRWRRAIVGIALEPIRRLPAIDVSAAVMHRVAPRRASLYSQITGAARWLWSPRPLTLRPAYALAGALAVLAAVFGSQLRPGASVSPVSSMSPVASASPVPSVSHVGSAAPARVLVQFRLGDANAHEVALVGDFNGWRPAHRLHQVAPGVWTLDVALEPGVYHYVFVVDGKAWRLDPLAPRVTDGFGGSSSRVSVLASEARS
ncbi:MAG TPA: glycogen-binding domain-containing protein, partial [Gemmatimonadales bacterium]|nr:glycogen-binding domain-containing protein [Gemmatimonadales bacterium]